MARAKPLMGYGTEADRARLRALADATGKSSSEVIINLIRSTYAELYGDQDPMVVAPPPPNEVE